MMSANVLIRCALPVISAGARAVAAANVYGILVSILINEALSSGKKAIFDDGKWANTKHLQIIDAIYNTGVKFQNIRFDELLTTIDSLRSTLLNNPKQEHLLSMLDKLLEEINHTVMYRNDNAVWDRRFRDDPKTAKKDIDAALQKAKEEEEENWNHLMSGIDAVPTLSRRRRGGQKRDRYGPMLDLSFKESPNQPNDETQNMASAAEYSFVKWLTSVRKVNNLIKLDSLYNQGGAFQNGFNLDRIDKLDI